MIETAYALTLATNSTSIDNLINVRTSTLANPTTPVFWSIGAQALDNTSPISFVLEYVFSQVADLSARK